MTKVRDLRPVMIFDNTLTENQKGMVQFEIYLNDKKGSKPCSYWDFIEFLEMYQIDGSSTNAALLEAGGTIKVPEGTVRFDRTSPSEEEVLSITATPKISEFEVINTQGKM
ncbi:MAG: hypothetical protein ACI8Q1_003272 [Parvicella sp.]|jgi:hypothetical protein